MVNPVGSTAASNPLTGDSNSSSTNMLRQQDFFEVNGVSSTQSRSHEPPN